MRFLLIHAKSMKYRCTKEVKIPFKDEVDDLNTWHEYENVLVAFTGIEKQDEKDAEQISEKGAGELNEILQRVKADSILVYPYAHLFSEKLASAKKALQILNMLVESVKNKGVKVDRAPFGWYKEFIIHCLGHPLSESSRQVNI